MRAAAFPLVVFARAILASALIFFAFALGTSPASPAAAAAPDTSDTPRVPDVLETLSIPPTRVSGAPLTAERLQSGLQAALDSLAALGRPALVLLLPGHHDLEPVAHVDPSCGNCEDPDTTVSATRALRVSGTGIEIVGVSPESVFIHTNAGYGVLFDGCRDCALRGVTVMGGARDRNARATDAGVVVRESRVTIEGCVIRDNIGDPRVVDSVKVGVIGIAGREGAEITVRDNRIVRNSWDGIALYRGARAEIRDNVIDGVDKAQGETVGGGRGVGIGLTWNARAIVEGNLVTRYWKGIGLFVDAQAEVRQNVVEDVLTWGIAYWDAERGSPVADIRENAIYGTGACGILITREERGEQADSAKGTGTTGSATRPAAAAGDPHGTDGNGAEDDSIAPGDAVLAIEPPGALVGNAFVMTGQNPKYDAPDYYCHQEAIAEEAVPEGFEIADNLFFANREARDTKGREDVDADTFQSAVRPLVEMLAARPALRVSRFVRDFAPK